MDHESRGRGTAGVLIVDDVEINRTVLEEIISDMGCRPFLAESGRQALDMIDTCRPQLILSDISMPEMDGYELCRRLKAREDTKAIPVVFISVYDEPQDMVEGFTIGGADYITKPFIPEVVQARVGVHLRLYQTNRELTEMNRRLQISVRQQQDQLETEKKNVLYALANIAARSSDCRKGYMERLGECCRILAQGMQLSPAFEGQVSDTFIDTVEVAAGLCDIGNIAIPREILRKKGGLTAEEKAALRRHTEIGADIVKDLYVNNDYNDFISISVDIIRCHHENWDGSGYPEGLRGDAIPLAAQIVSIMEDYCMLTEEACGREEALQRMAQEAGKKYNPDIFKICSKISRQLR